MGSLAVSDAGGHHFLSRMFGGGSTHHQTQTQESPAVQHSSVRPSPHVDATPALRVAPPQDTPMVDSAAPTPASATPQPGHSSKPSSQTPAHMPPPSPRMQPNPTPTQTTGQSTPNQAPPPSTPLSPRSNMPPPQSPAPSGGASPRRIKVKNLEHIQSFASDESMRSLSRRQRRDGTDVGTQYEISSMPVTDIIEMVAGLLTKITTTNDRQHEHLHRHINPTDGTTNLNQKTTSVLAFHGKNVPSISILSYLSRIHKYCPTTYEVFLSLLVYFDRMTERVNAGPMQSLRQANQQSLDRRDAESDVSPQTAASTASASQPEPPSQQPASVSAQAATPPPSGSLGKPAETDVQGNQPTPPTQQIEPPLEVDPLNLSQFFVVDSFNIHRLVIAGVTCASKFFSDVFYTNSRYAKVGGLPLPELNHLELQFLILNDFRLAVPLEEMEAYGTMLVEFYAREVAGDRSGGGRSRANSGVTAQ